MKKFTFLISILILVTSCSEKESNLMVHGSVKGLKKGTLYLQKIEGTDLINVDSTVVTGDASFEMSDYIKSPQIMYLYLDKTDNTEYDDRVEFFAEAGEVTIETTLKNFEVDAKIVGSTNQAKLVEYRNIMKRFNDQNLDLIQKNFQAQKDNDEEAILKTNTDYDRLLKRKYLYTVNYALNNKDLEIAPYLALSEVFDANIKYLDTIYSSLTPQVRKSNYGKELKKFLKNRRKDEKLEEKVEEQ